MANIKLTNGVKIDQDSLDVVMPSLGMSNLIGTGSTAVTGTATANCIIAGSHYNGAITVDGTTVYPASSNAKNFCLIVDKGQVVVLGGVINSTYTARAGSIE